MEAETLSENMEEQAEGEMKNCPNMIKKQVDELKSKASIKENGTSDHSEVNHDTETADENNSNQSNGEDHLLENDKLNREDMNAKENGEVTTNDTNVTNGDKETENNDSAVQNNIESTQNEELDSDSLNNTKLDKVGSLNEDNNKLESVENSDESQDSVIDDKKENAEVTEKSEPSAIDAVASEDSSKDSTDSSISAASDKKSDTNVDESVENNDATNVDHVLNSFEKDLKDVEMEEGEVKKSNEDKNDKVKDDNMEVDESKPKTEVDTENKSDDKKENELSEAKSDSAKEAAAVKPPPLQQPSVSYMLPVSSVPYSLSQQQLTIHQQQTGYITKVGNQHIFVPVPGAGPLAGAMNIAPTLSSSQPPAKPAATEKPESLAPKSSFEMIELMKWEIQNRIPDNYNWSVAFHPKKEELSTVSSFLLELGHDVVKEAVYKDIILIQTKKKEQGILKETEIESLEKMKTVYENTKKKVEHLDMKKLVCKHKPCKFQTTSSLVMEHHKDHPHVDPPWDWHGGYLCCAHCDFRTKQTAAFSFHMEAVHNAVAKMPDKPGLFPCEMCPMELTTKNKLLKHRVKCMKTFKLNINLQPYYHDVNFCMKTCYYKPKKPKYIPPPAKKPDPRQAVAARQLPNRPAGVNQAGIKQNMMQAQYAPRPPPLQRQPLSITPIVRAPPAAYNRQAQPGISKSPVVRQMIQQQKQGGTPPSKEMSGFEVCELCGGYVKDRQALRIHFYYAHKVEMPQTIFNRPSPPLSCDVCQSKFWTTQGLQKHKSTLRHYSTATPSTSKAATHKCFMCSRNVTNLFVHVEQSHGMTMKDLVSMKKCIMCGITAADRKALEVHLSTLHGVLIKANDYDGAEKPAQPAKNPVPLQPKASTPNAPTGAPSKGKSMVRNNLCVFCQIQFADNIQLTMHCIKIHATCSACGMVVASSKNLANHNCKKMMRDCDICGLKKLAPDAYAVHIKKHVKPCSVKVDNMSDHAVESTKEDIKKNYKPAVISLDSDSGGESDVEVVDDNAKTEKDKESKKVNDKKSRKDLGVSNDDENSNQAIGEDSSKVENEAEKDAAENESESKEDQGASKEVDDNSEIGNKDESSQDSKNETESKLGTEDELSRDSNVDESSRGSVNKPESDSAKITEENMDSRKRKNSNDSDSEESKRLKSESDNLALDNASDSESKGAEDANIPDVDGGNAEDDDSTGGIKRPCEEVQEEANGDSGTESDQASKRRKLTDTTE